MTVHAYPEDGWTGHRTDGAECPCEPETEYLDADGLPGRGWITTGSAGGSP